jgi:hypothetical protein
MSEPTFVLVVVIVDTTIRQVGENEYLPPAKRSVRIPLTSDQAAVLSLGQRECFSHHWLERGNGEAV